MTRAIAIVLATVLAATPALADDSSLVRAQHAFDQVRFEEARDFVADALQSGTLQPPELAQAYRLAGMVAVVMGTATAEEQFRRALAVAPDLQMPEGVAPKQMRAFEQARSYIAQHGTLSAKVIVEGTRVSITIANDPLGLVTRLTVRLERGSVDGRVAGTAEVILPANSQATAVELRDAHGNIVRTLGASELEYHDVKAAALPLYRRPLVWAVGTVVLAGAGGIATYYANVAHSDLDAIIADSATYTFTEAEEKRTVYRRNAYLADAAFIASGALAVVGVIMYATRPKARVLLRPSLTERGAAVEVRW